MNEIPGDDLRVSLDLALSQAKRVQRESRKVVQQLGAIQDIIKANHPTADRHKEYNEHRREDREDR